MSEKQFISFKLNDAVYGVDIHNVGGIIEYSKATPMPNMPDYFEGVVSIRGSIIPIINLKKLFNLGGKEDLNISARILLYQISGKDIGFVVDETSQVFKLLDQEIESPPSFANKLNKEYIDGIGKVKDEMILLIDMQKILDFSVFEHEETIKLIGE